MMWFWLMSGKVVRSLRTVEGTASYWSARTS